VLRLVLLVRSCPGGCDYKEIGSSGLNPWETLAEPADLAVRACPRPAATAAAATRRATPACTGREPRCRLTVLAAVADDVVLVRP
jgi:hypothetical protein